MTTLQIIVSPAVGKKVEFEQSIVYFQNNTDRALSNFNVVVEGEDKYQILFNFETGEDAKRLLESNSFTLLSGAIQTLCEKQSLTLTNRENNINILNCENFSKIKNYFNIN